jgi:hypothetical protein
MGTQDLRQLAPNRQANAGGHEILGQAGHRHLRGLSSCYDTSVAEVQCSRVREALEKTGINY